MRVRIALLCAALLAATAVAAEPPGGDRAVAAPPSPKDSLVEEVVVTAKRPLLPEPRVVLEPVVRVEPPTPCIEIGTKRCEST